MACPRPILSAALAIALAFVLVSAPWAAQTTPAPARKRDAANLAPYVPTPQEVVDRMLKLAGVTKDDVVYDLGCGDGRIVISAAQQYGARGVGIDIDPVRIAESNANAKRAGVTNLVTFKQQDALATNVAEATVVTLYLLSASNLKLRPILTKQLRPGARIVAHAFAMGDWPAERVENFIDSAGSARTLYLWKTDGKIRP